MFVFFGIIIVYSIHAALPTNPLNLPFKKNYIQELGYPRDGGFYSKSPREDMIMVYDLETGDSAVAWPNNAAKNFFGIKRFGRSQGIEIGLLIYKLSKDTWHECKKDAMVCLKNTEDTVKIKNPNPKPTVCGVIGFLSKHHQYHGLGIKMLRIL